MAISLAESLMLQADKAAQEMGISRSGLIAEALREFLQKRREAEITKQINLAHANDPEPAERKLVNVSSPSSPARTHGKRYSSGRCLLDGFRAAKRLGTSRPAALRSRAKRSLQ